MLLPSRQRKKERFRERQIQTGEETERSSHHTDAR